MDMSQSSFWFQPHCVDVELASTIEGLVEGLGIFYCGNVAIVPPLVSATLCGCGSKLAPQRDCMGEGLGIFYSGNVAIIPPSVSATPCGCGIS